MMRISCAILALALAAFAGAHYQGLAPVARGETVSTETPLSRSDGAAPAAAETARFVGLTSCSLSNCHGGREGTVGAEYTIWARDPHARAFDSLRTEAAVAMTQGLGIKDPPHEAAQCLGCHAADASIDRRTEHFAISEGVSCEACHGAAEHWLGPHATPAWRGLTPSQKEAYGMRDTDSLSARTQLCAECHVGGPGRVVSHDLIALGHPPLMFEMTAYHDALPKHWNPARDTSRDPAYKARMWLMGQAVAPRLQLESLALDERGFGIQEFALFDCFSCHADLKLDQGESVAFSPDLRPGDAAWGSWTVSLLHSLQAAENLAVDRPLAGASALRKNVRLQRVNAAIAREAVTTGLADLRAWGLATETTSLSPKQLSSMLIAVAHIDPQQTRLDWHSAWQRYLGLRAIYISRLQAAAAAGGAPPRDPQFERRLQELRSLLPFPPDYSGPFDFDARPLQTIFDEIHQHLSSSVTTFHVPFVRTPGDVQ